MPARAALPLTTPLALSITFLTACASAPREGAPDLAVIEERAAAADAAGYPDLSAIRAPAARPTAAALAADAAALEAEAAALRTLREEARRGADPSALAAEGAALRAAVARDRAAVDAAPDIAVPDDLRRSRGAAERSSLSAPRGGVPNAPGAR